MDWGKLKFFLGEVLRNFSRNAGMQITAIGTVAITIVLLGLFLFVRAAVADLGATPARSDRDLRVSSLRRNATHKSPRWRVTWRKIRASRRHDSFLARRRSPSCARVRSGTIDTALLTENPLPDKFRIKVRHTDDVPAVAAGVRRLSGVDNVVYGQKIVARLLQLGAVLRRVGIGVIVVFFAVAGIIISNTIRLTVFARRREIAIMQLVGATNTYIRLPFICEGMLAGAFGALVAIGLLAAARATLWPRLLEALPWAQLAAAPLDVRILAGELVAVGAAIGIVASWISVGRHLRT